MANKTKRPDNETIVVALWSGFSPRWSAERYNVVDLKYVFQVFNSHVIYYIYVILIEENPHLKCPIRVWYILKYGVIQINFIVCIPTTVIKN